MIARIAALCCAFLCVYGTTGCKEITDTGPGPDPLTARQLPQGIRTDADAVVAGNNRFALDLYRNVKKEQEGNLFFSPFSVSTAFAMTYAGARGTTEAEMAAVFHFPGEPVRLHEGFEALLHSLDTGAGFGGYRLNIANRLWCQSGFTMLGPFLDITRERYGAGLEPVNFKTAPEDARNTINTWVEDKTNGKIQDLMPRGSITTDTRLVLTNAVYFKGLWLRQFDPAQTRNRDFRVDATRTVSVPIMSQKGDFDFGRPEGLKVLRLPYQTQDLAMIFLLPDADDGLAGVEDRLTPDNLAAWLESADEATVTVFIPRFRIESKFSLNGTLSDMGMPTAFDDRADFSGMTGAMRLVIQSAVHQGYVEVNEEGTEAAAATGIGVGVTSVPPTFTADHPFLILIRDEVTGSILFLGRVVDPSA
jgi:serpin B